MRKALVALTVTLVLAFAGTATAALQPGVYDPGNLGCVHAAQSFGVLTLEKTCPTSANASAYAVITGQNGHRLTQLSFEYRGYCGAGSPRFNVTVYPSHETFFFGCLYGLHEDLGDGWTRVTFTGAEPGGAGAFGQVIDSIALLADEQGSTQLRHVKVNGVVQS